MEGGYPWEIDDTRSPHDTWSKTDRRSPPPHSAADYDMEGPFEPFIPQRLDAQAGSRQQINTVRIPTHAQITQVAAM